MAIKFQIPDMTCGHCVSTITNAIQAKYDGAQVEAEVETHTLTVQGTEDAEGLESIIKQEGYSPARL
ncbi:MAG TPA: heavy-metal-associated domain-containing protein [Paenalcaligenes sp.]|nr:heavy-metal-associated domain-containing protein [Paenalcaligenes sp.]